MSVVTLMLACAVACSASADRGDVREPGVADAAEHDDHAGAAGRRRRASRARRAARTRQRHGRSAGVLPRRGDAEAVERLRHQDRSLAARRRTGTASSRRSATAHGTARSATPAMADALRRGYATSSTDTGHVGGSASFALGHPEKLIDFAYRSEHEMTVKAKAIVNAFYGSRAEVLVLERLLGGRTAGAQGSPDVSRPTSTASSPARRASTGPAARRRRVRIAQVLRRTRPRV